MLHAHTSDRAFDQRISHTPKFYKKFASAIPRRDRERIFRVPNVIYLDAPPTAAWECLSLISVDISLISVDKCSSPPPQKSIGIVPQLLTGGSSVVGSELSCSGSRFQTLWERPPDKKAGSSRVDVSWQNPCGLSWGAAEAMALETSGYFARGMGRDTVAGLNVCGFSHINKNRRSARRSSH